MHPDHGGRHLHVRRHRFRVQRQRRQPVCRGCCEHVARISAHGQLFLGGLAVNAGDTISAANIAAGMLTYTPFADRFNGQTSFDFSVRDNGASGGGHQNTDQSPDTMRMTFTGGNGADNVDATPGAPTLFSPTTGQLPSFADLSTSVAMNSGGMDLAASSTLWTCSGTETTCRSRSIAIPRAVCSLFSISSHRAVT